MKFLKFSRKQTERGSEILKFTSVPRNRFEILKFTLASARLTSQHTHDATEKRSAVNINQYLNSAWRRIALRSAAIRHGYKTARAENFSKFSLTGALLNFISLPPRKFKLVLLKFSPAPSRNGFEILKFVPELSDGFEILKFTSVPHKFKPAPAMRLNFDLNSVSQARAAKFENGVKFEGAAKFKRGAR